MYLHKLVWLAVENLAQRWLRTAFLVLTVAIGAGATMFLFAFHRGLDKAIKDNLLKGMPDKSLVVKTAEAASTAVTSQLSGLFTLGQGETRPTGITPEDLATFRRLHEDGVTRHPVEIKTRPLLPFLVRVQPDFDRLKGVFSLAKIAISERDRRNAGGPVMFHGIDAARAAEELPVEIEIGKDEVPIWLSREWLQGADNFAQVREKKQLKGKRERNLRRLASLADNLFFNEGASGVPVFLLLSKGGHRKVVEGRIVGFSHQASLHGLSVDSQYIEQWAAWNNEGKQEGDISPLSYNTVTIETRTTDDMLAAAAAIARDERLDVSGRLVTAERLTNLRDMLPPATLVIGVILFFLAAGGIVVGLSLSVAEQTKRIGILRSVGAKQLDILFLFLCEALIVGLLGVACGLGLAYASMDIVDPVIRQTIPGIDEIDGMFHPSKAFNTMVGAVGVLVALLAGLVPAFTATLIRPSEVLKA